MMSSFRNFMEFFIPISIMVSVLAGLFQIVKYRNAIARWSGLVLIGISINLVCYFFLLNDLFLEWSKFLFVLQVIGYLLMDMSFLVFVIYFTGHPKWITTASIIFISIIPAIIIALMVFQWGSIPITAGGKGAAFGVDTNIFKTPVGAFDVLFVGYSNFIGFFAIFLLFSMLFNTPSRYRNAVMGLLLGIIVIMGAGLSEIFDLSPFNDISILQSAVAINSIPIFLIVFAWKAAGSIPISQQLFKDMMRDGYVIIDSQNKVVDYNHAAEDLIGKQVKLEAGSLLPDLIPNLRTSLDLAIEKRPNPVGPILVDSQGLISEIMIYPVGSARNDLSTSMVVFHNVTERDHLEDTLRKNNIELSRSNAFFSSLANLTVSLQTSQDTAVIMDSLGVELRRLGLQCFIALYMQGSSELFVQYFSENMQVVRAIEKVIGTHVRGFRLNREHFSSLYDILETRRIHYLPDEESGLRIFLGNFPGWIMDPLIKASMVSRNEASMVIPLIAAEKVVGLMGVWGHNLLETDIAPFQLFGSQVGWAIEKATLQEAELRRLEELSHSNAMITTLSKVSSHLEAISDNELAFVSLGEELAKIDLSCAILTLDQMKETATARYISLETETLRKIERLTKFPLVGHQFPKALWPDEKAIKEGAVDWYSDVEIVFKKLFPNFSDSLRKKISLLMKGNQTVQLCYLPLKVQGDIIGVMPIWGHNLDPKDSITLSIFSDQVAAILRRNTSYENEIRKSGELARLNSMIMALSGVASQLDSTSDFHQVLDTLGKELKKVNLSCMVGTIDETKQTMKVEYITFWDEFMQISKKIGIIWQEEMKIPRHLWPTDKAITEKAPVWDPYPIGNAYRMFPNIPKNLFNDAMRLVGWDLSEPVCYLPMIDEEDVIGILSVWGKELKKEDVPALSIFANQVTTAIKNSRLYMNAQKEIDVRTEAEARTRKALTEKEVLLKEVHHRVKNNLQVISSLLNLQAAQITDPYTLDALKESQNRVRSMALIHEKLYQSDDLALIDFQTYLQSLVHSLFQSYRVNASKIEIQVQAEKILLDLDTAIPCGLMVNELVSNSIKYAFPDGHSGKIQVSCRLRSDNRYSLIICDDGIGLPSGFDYTKSSSLGLKLVNSLIRQIDGELIVDGVKGTRFEIQFARHESPG